MREIVLGEGFVQSVQRLGGNANELLGTVKVLATTMDQLPSDTAEGKIYHMLVTGRLVGKDLSREEVEISLLELCRIRREKGDGFDVPNAKEKFLTHTEEYKSFFNCVGKELEVGMAINTMVSYLNGVDKHDTTLSRMGTIIERLDQKGRSIEEDERREEAMLELFFTLILQVCAYENVQERYGYICSMAREYGHRAFVRAFAAMFLRLSKEYI